MTDDDRKAKDVVIDADTQHDLERWFGLPSFAQLEEEGKQPQVPTAKIDPGMKAVIERRDKALAAIDPALVEAMFARHDKKPEDVLMFDGKIELRVAENFGAVDQAMIERAGSLADPRSVERPEDLEDALKECTPQALLRDLHRSERDFEKAFDVIDMAAEQRMDIVAEVKAAMNTRWTLEKPPEPPLAETQRVLGAVKADRDRSWLEYLPRLPNRRTSE